jgi:hypothetical protein
MNGLTLTVDDMFNPDNLHESFKLARKGVNWKESTQRFNSHELIHILELSKNFKFTKGFVEFDIHERGKKRHISSVHISERVIQKSICRNVLLPVLLPKFVYDTSASFIKRGMHFSVKRLKMHMRRFWLKYGTDGYCLRVDIKKFFDSIDHQVLKKQIRPFYTNEVLRWIFTFIDEFPGSKGLGLGSEVSQILANWNLNPIDHFIKDEEQNPYFGRYMDDMYIIHHDKEYLKELLRKIKKRLSDIKLEVNENKTYISILSKGIIFLQGIYRYENSGRIYVKMRKKSSKRMKRKLKKMVQCGVPAVDVYESWQSWKGSQLKRFDAWHAVGRVGAYYSKLLGLEACWR